MVKERKREDVVRECAQVALACWNHYSDTPLAPQQMKRLEAALDKVLPDVIVTSQFDVIREEHNKAVGDTPADCPVVAAEERGAVLLDELTAEIKRRGFKV